MNKNIALTLTFMLITTFMVLFSNMMSVDAVTSYATGVHGRIYHPENSTNGYTDEGQFTINNSLAFCVDFSTSFRQTDKQSQDALSFLTNKIGNETTAQEVLTKLALYYTYINSTSLSVNDKYYYMQTFLWEILDQYYNWRQGGWYYNTQGDYNTYKNGAEAYYQINKSKYKGTGTVWSDGSTQPLIQFGLEKVITAYYGLDVACKNCDSSSTGTYEGATFVIRDAATWQEIQDSTSLDGNAKTYYLYDGKYVCRNTYVISYPDETDYVGVASGSYFTVGLVGSDGVSNFGPIKVTRELTCRMSDSYSGSNSLSSLASKLTSKTAPSLGTITLSWDDNDSKSNDVSSTELTELATSKGVSSITTDSLGQALTVTWTSYYQLNSSDKNVPVYISSSGQSVGSATANKFSKTTTAYECIGPHLAHSYTDSSSNSSSSSSSSSIAGKITLKYTLPASSDSGYSRLYDLYKAGASSYFGAYAAVGEHSIYYGNNRNEYDLTYSSACGLLYKYGSSGYNTCAKQNINGSTSCKSGDINNYICEVKLDDGNNDGNSGSGNNNGNDGTDDNYSLTCYDINADGSYTFKSTVNGKTTTFNVDKSYFSTFLKGLNNSLVVTGNSSYCPTKVSRTIRQCSGGGSKKVCEATDDYYYCNIYDVDLSTGTKTLKDSGKCSSMVSKYSSSGIDNVYEDCHGVDVTNPPGGSSDDCSTTGTCTNGVNVIYRTIDLNSSNNAFPYITGTGRDSGDNWCWTDATGTYQCKRKSISHQRVIYNNRGYEGDEVYDATPMYSFTLDSATMKAIRKYNDSHEYGDFTLTCNDYDRACISKSFVRKYVKSGVCANSTKNNFYTCKRTGSSY